MQISENLAENVGRHLTQIYREIETQKFQNKSNGHVASPSLHFNCAPSTASVCNAILKNAFDVVKTEQSYNFHVHISFFSSWQPWETTISVHPSELEKNTTNSFDPKILEAVKLQARKYLIGLTQEWQEGPKELFPAVRQALFASNKVEEGLQLFQHPNPDPINNHAYTILQTFLKNGKQKGQADVLYPGPNNNLEKEKIYLLCTKEELENLKMSLLSIIIELMPEA